MLYCGCDIIVVCMTSLVMVINDDLYKITPVENSSMDGGEDPGQLFAIDGSWEIKSHFSLEVQ